MANTITYPNFKFDVLKTDDKTNARVSELVTPHGTINTPNFIFCGTKASIKTLNPRQVKESGADIILANTYHLMIQPGADLVEKMGGLHEFMQWDGPLLTDSGGYQIFAMGHGSVSEEIKGNRPDSSRKSLLKITEEGATFRSYKDGAKIFLSPEISMDIQRKLGADLVVQLDECTAFGNDKTYTAKSMEMSHRWGDRSLAQFNRHNDGKQGVYGVIQGGIYEDLRDVSTAYVNDRDFFGIAVGGCLGDTAEKMDEVVGWCMDRVRRDRPVHLLGIGRFRDIFAGVRKGIDTFDCVAPTRMARHGWALVKGAPNERLNLRNAKFREDSRPIDETCDGYAQTFTRAYLHHLIRANEFLAMQIITMHNVHTMSRLMREIRECIATGGDLDALEKEWRPEA